MFFDQLGYNTYFWDNGTYTSSLRPICSMASIKTKWIEKRLYKGSKISVL